MSKPAPYTNNAPALLFALLCLLLTVAANADFGLSTNNVILVNETGLHIVRVQIDDKKLEDVSGKHDRIFITVTPEKHDLKLFFKGGAQIDWPDFDFRNIHQITFERVKNKINAHFEFYARRPRAD